MVPEQKTIVRGSEFRYRAMWFLGRKRSSIMRYSRLSIILGAAVVALLWASGAGAQSSASATKTISEADCVAAKLGGSIPSSAIGEPVAGITLSEPRWNAAAKGGGPYC